MSAAPPTGIVTFLFTDIGGSTERWERDRAAMQAALAGRNAILDRVIEAHIGPTFMTMGDAHGAAFADCVTASMSGETALRLA